MAKRPFRLVHLEKIPGSLEYAYFMKGPVDISQGLPPWKKTYGRTNQLYLVQLVDVENFQATIELTSASTGMITQSVHPIQIGQRVSLGENLLFDALPDGCARIASETIIVTGVFHWTLTPHAHLTWASP